MSNEVCRIDPTLNLGLHELSEPREGRGSFRFQLKFAEDQIAEILRNLDSLVENTIAMAPMREVDFKLNRPPSRPVKLAEAKWERTMHAIWHPKGSVEFVPVCRRIQTYQCPLQGSRKDERWGRIDLLGIGTDSLPVPIELKQHGGKDSPLRMLVEVAAYGLAIRKVWPNLKREWCSALDLPPSRFPETLDRMTLIGVAPEEYWSGFLGKFPPKPFWELVDALGQWFDIHFVALEGRCADDITGARILDRVSQWPAGFRPSTTPHHSSTPHDRTAPRSGQR